MLLHILAIAVGRALHYTNQYSLIAYNGRVNVGIVLIGHKNYPRLVFIESLVGLAIPTVVVVIPMLTVLL